MLSLWKTVVTACQLPSETRCLLLCRNSVFKNLLHGIVLSGSCHCSGSQVPTPHCRGLGASLDQSIWDLWWTICREAGLSQSTPVLLPVLPPLLHTNHWFNPAVLRRTKCEAWESSYKPVMFWWRSSPSPPLPPNLSPFSFALWFHDVADMAYWCISNAAVLYSRGTEFESFRPKINGGFL